MPVVSPQESAELLSVLRDPAVTFRQALEYFTSHWPSQTTTRFQAACYLLLALEVSRKTQSESPARCCDLDHRHAFPIISGIIISESSSKDFATQRSVSQDKLSLFFYQHLLEKYQCVESVFKQTLSTSMGCRCRKGFCKDRAAGYRLCRSYSR